MCPAEKIPDTNRKCVSKAECKCIGAESCLGKPGDTACPLANEQNEKTTYCQKFSRGNVCVDTCEDGHIDRFRCETKTVGNSATLSPPDKRTGLRLYRSGNKCKKYEISTDAGCEVACSQSEQISVNGDRCISEHTLFVYGDTSNSNNPSYNGHQVQVHFCPTGT